MNDMHGLLSNESTVPRDRLILFEEFASRFASALWVMACEEVMTIQRLEREYRQETGKNPPGSNRTSRLWKKRASALLKWNEGRASSITGQFGKKSNFANHERDSTPARPVDSRQ